MNIIRFNSLLFYFILFEYVKTQIYNESTGTATGTTTTTTTAKISTKSIPIIMDKTINAHQVEAINLTTIYFNLTKNFTENESRKFNEKFNGKSKELKSSTILDIALQSAARHGLDAMLKLYNKIEPDILRNGNLLDSNHPAAILSKFSAPTDDNEKSSKAAFAALMATKSFQKSYKRQTEDLGRQATTTKISFRRTALEGLCPQREPPVCLPAAKRYRTHDGTCNNPRRPRWGSSQMPFNRFLPPEYGDGIDTIRGAVDGGALSSARFVSLLVHGAREGNAPVTLILAQWGQLVDHDLTSTAQPRSINGSIPRCCGPNDFHPACFPIKVPLDDPWLSPLKVRCLEFLRSAPAQRRDCVLSWREQTNQVTSYLDASPIYSSNSRTSDNARVFRHGLLLFGRGNPNDDVCHKGAIGTQCIRPGDARSSEQPGLMALHHVWVGEHNRIALELSAFNPHWSDEKVYQETRRIVGAIFQHITFREFLPLVLGREVCRLFDLDLLNSGYYTGYDKHINPTIANSFAAAAFRFGHSLVQGTYLRCDRNYNFIDNNVTLHDEFSKGDIGSAGSLHRLLRGMAAQRALNRDEFISPELTNHLFQSGNFPFGLDLAAINIQRGRDHGIPQYTSWREPCGLSPIHGWEDMINIVGPESTQRIRHAYESVHDIDLFVGGISERPVVGGLIGPTFACIIAQQFSNLRKGDRFWYENAGFESSFTPAQLHSIRRVSLAQILCRTIGDGTMQPHVFIPHVADGNHRIRCGFGPLAPMDLFPWQEEDPFKNAHIDQSQKDIQQSTTSQTTTINDTLTETQPNNNDEVDKDSKSNNVLLLNRIDFVPNSSIGFHKPNDKTNIHNKLDFVHTFSTKQPIQPNKSKPTVNNKLDMKVTRKPTIIQQPSINKKTTTKRTVIINNVAIELGRTANSTSKPKNSTITKVTIVTTTTDSITNKIRVKRTDIEGTKMSREYLLVSVNNKTSKTTNSTVNKKTITSSTITSKRLPTTSNPLELRNFYEQENTYNRPQNIVIDGLQSDQQIDIEINIRQINKNKNKNKPNQQQAIQTFDYNKPFEFDYSNNKISSPVRNDFDYNNNPTPSSPFSYRPKPTRPQTYYELGGSNFDFGTTTKHPKIIYINDESRLTTARPGFLQTLFSFGNTNTNNLNKNNNAIDYEKNDYNPKPNRVGANVYSLSGSNGLTNGISNGGSALLSGIMGGANQYESNNNNNNINTNKNNHKNNNAETVLSINIRPAAPVSTFDSYPVIDSRPVQVVVPPRKPNFQSPSNYGFLNPSQSSFLTTTQPFYEPSYPSFISTTTKPTRQSYFNFGETDYEQTYNHRPILNYRPTYNYGQEQDIGYKELPNFPEHKELTNYQGGGRSEFNITDNDQHRLYFNETNITEIEPFNTSTNNASLNFDSQPDYYYDYDEIDSEDKQFDKDGYLRPEHMIIDMAIKTNPTTIKPDINITTNLKTFNDNFVIPILNKNYEQLLTKRNENNKSTETETETETTTIYTDAIPRVPLTEITADDFEELPSKNDLNLNDQKPLTRTTNKPINNLERILIPINVLTKPERPDNWVIFDTLNEKPLLPELPELNSDIKSSTKEFPKPMIRNKRKWRTVFWNPV